MIQERSLLFHRIDDRLVTIENSGLSSWKSEHHGLMGEISAQWRRAGRQCNEISGKTVAMAWGRDAAALSWTVG